MKKFQPYGDAAMSPIVAKVGKGKTPPSLAARIESADLLSKVGAMMNAGGDAGRRVVRLNVSR